LNGKKLRENDARELAKAKTSIYAMCVMAPASNPISQPKKDPETYIFCGEKQRKIKRMLMINTENDAE
jgi:hypothetical protein